jgi:predicted PurR-regulated permease PerM
MAKEGYTKYALMGLFLVILASAFLIIRPFVSTILTSFIIAYMFYPVYKFFKKFVKNKTLAASIVSIIIVLLFAVPLIFVASSIMTESSVGYSLVKQILSFENKMLGDCEGEDIVCKIGIFIEEKIRDPDLQLQISNIINSVTGFLIGKATDIVFSIPLFLLNFFVMVFIVFYLLKEGKFLLERIRALLPLKKSHKKNVFEQLNGVTSAVIYGHILTAAIQAILGVLAFWIFEVPSPLFWGLIMFFFALIPFMGTPIVWIPAVIIKAFSGSIGAAIGLLIAGIFISTIDNLIKPALVSGKAKVHPVLVLLGVLGGIYTFGLIGVIIGPVVLSVFMTFIKIYEEEKSEIKS